MFASPASVEGRKSSMGKWQQKARIILFFVHCSLWYYSCRSSY